jgi:hypothetical protein
MKATLEQLSKSYSRTGSVWKTAAEFGMAGGSVHERLAKAGLIVRPIFTEEHRDMIFSAYQQGFKTGDGTLDRLAEATGHLKSNICRLARQMGLTNPNRAITAELSGKLQSKLKTRNATIGHAKGMLGKCHTDQVKAIIGAKSKTSWHSRTQQENADIVMKAMKTRANNGTPFNKHGSWKAAWTEVGGVRFYARSRWEANYARYLQFLKEKAFITSWEHEPETFWFEAIKRGCRSYLPDFKVTLPDGAIEYHEVKGWMDARSVTKIKRMAKYHPKITLVVRDAKWYCANRPTLRAIIKGWEG